MKITLLYLLLAGLSFGACASTNGCKEQEADISAKLDAAKSSNNKYAQQGLENALVNVKMYCNEDKQKKQATRAVQEKQQKVNQADQELKLAEKELNEAIADGNPSEISHKKNRVNEKTARLSAANVELKQAQDDDERLNK